MELSLILPYWQRQAVAERSLSLLAEHYSDMDLEVVVVDDGSPEPFKAPRLPFVRTVCLPKKDVPKNPCLPINIGVKLALGNVIALSGPDILHTKPVLQEMFAELRKQGPKGYVQAAVWMPEQSRWVSHSTLRREASNDVGHLLPTAAGYHFMTMLNRSLWDAAGGFDEDYREGCGYDDPDFVLRLHRAGAKFVQRDDLVVEHIREGARAAWPVNGFARNRSLFFSKWQKAEAA